MSIAVNMKITKLEKRVAAIEKALEEMLTKKEEPETQKKSKKKD